jgi:hypothetical protein
MNCNDLSEISTLYLSGELDEDRAAEFDSHLRGCSYCSVGIEQQKDWDVLLRDGVLAEEIDPSAVDLHVRQTIQAAHQAKVESQVPARSYRLWIPAAAAVILLALVANVGYRHWFGGAVAPVYAAVVHDHQVEVVERARRPWVSDYAVIQLMAARQGVSQSAFAALGPQNYRLDRGKICPLAGNVYLHLVYTDGTHELSVFLHQGEMAPLPGVSRGSADGKVLRAAAIGPDYVAAFRSGSLTALIVTDQSAPAALDAARSVARVL